MTASIKMKSFDKINVTSVGRLVSRNRPISTGSLLGFLGFFFGFLVWFLFWEKVAIP